MRALFPAGGPPSPPPPREAVICGVGRDTEKPVLLKKRLLEKRPRGSRGGRREQEQGSPGQGLC